MSNQLYNGQSLDIDVPAGQSLIVGTPYGTYSATTLYGAGAGTALATNSTDGGTYGPYAGGVTIRLSAGALGSVVDFDVSASPSLNYCGPVYWNGTSMVDKDGNPQLRIDAGSSGADTVSPQMQHMSSIDAMSTTVTVRLTPTGTYRKARISWVNNGASGTAKLNIAANCGNDVEGLVASQSALQRDAQITMGGAMALVSPTPITSLNFSSDGAIVSDTHRLLVTFGA